MIDRDLIKKYVREEFPYLTPFDGQLEVIEDIIYEFVVNNKQHVVLDAPTGSGKSVIAYTVIKVLRKINHIRRAQIITSTKVLQNQYAMEFGISSLMAKPNYSCHRGCGHYNTWECLAEIKKNHGCHPKAECPYVKARNFWCNIAGIRVTNTSFMLEACSTIIAQPENFADFMVIDECHKLEELILNHAKMFISCYSFIELQKFMCSIKADAAIESCNKLLDFLKASADELGIIVMDDTLKDLASALCADIEVIYEEINSLRNTLDEKYEEDRSLMEVLTSIQDEISNLSDYTYLLKSINIGSKLYIEIIDATAIEIKTTNADIVSNWMLFRKSKKFLHMSGTVCGYEYHLKKMGISKEVSAYIKVKNNIPIENRQINCLPICRIRGNTYSDISAVILFIDRLLDHYKDKKGFIYCPSYALCNTIVQNSSHKLRMKLPSSAQEALEILSGNKKNTIVVSPSLTEGVDLKNDICRFQIIPRIPYLNLGDKLVKIKLDVDDSYYYRTTVMKLVQICGRGVRGTQDWAHTYILDSTFPTLVDRNLQYFPEWFIESIKYFRQ